MVLLLKCFFLLILFKKFTLRDQSFREWKWQSLNFIYLCCLHCGYQGKIILILQMSTGHIFLPSKYLFLLTLYKKLTLSGYSFRKWAWHFPYFGLSNSRESCFKASKVALDEYFYRQYVQFFSNFVQKIGFEWSQFQKIGVSLCQFF